MGQSCQCSLLFRGVCTGRSAGRRGANCSSLVCCEDGENAVVSAVGQPFRTAGEWIVSNG